MKNPLIAWVPAAVYMALIWVLSSMTFAIHANVGFTHTDKVIHFFEYAGLAFLVGHAVLRTWPEQSSMRAWAIAIVITIAWGLLDELHQAYVPGREADVFDLVADALGALAGGAVRVGLRADVPPATDGEAPT